MIVMGHSTNVISPNQTDPQTLQLNLINVASSAQNKARRDDIGILAVVSL